MGFTEDGVLILKCIFQTIWRLFTSWCVPGTDVTPAEFILFLAFAGVSLRFFFRMIGITPDMSTFYLDREPPHVPDVSGSPRLNAPNRR